MLDFISLSLSPRPVEDLTTSEAKGSQETANIHYHDH